MALYTGPQGLPDQDQGFEVPDSPVCLWPHPRRRAGVPESLCISADQGVRDAIWSPHELRRFWRNPLVSLSGRGGGGSSQSLPQLVDSEALRPPDSKLSKGESRAASGSCFNSSPSGTSWGSGGRAEGRENSL